MASTAQAVGCSSANNWAVRREAVVLGEFETQSSWESVDTCR